MIIGHRQQCRRPGIVIVKACGFDSHLHDEASDGDGGQAQNRSDGEGRGAGGRGGGT